MGTAYSAVVNTDSSQNPTHARCYVNGTLCMSRYFTALMDRTATVSLKNKAKMEEQVNASNSNLGFYLIQLQRVPGFYWREAYV